MAKEYDWNDLFLQIEQPPRRSRSKTCQACGRKVQLREHYVFCAACISKMERGVQLHQLRRQA
jgi:Zn finger protein HypA/HybF involved in hydrogenase expression